MLTATSRILLFAALLMQCLLGSFQGRTVCIALERCETHAGRTSSGDVPIGTDADHARCDGAGHGHGLVDPRRHGHDDCGCHMHLPLVDDGQIAARSPELEFQPPDVIPPARVATTVAVRLGPTGPREIDRAGVGADLRGRVPLRI